ncbi:MAG: hypothetical protein EA411_13005, partial [Saprospirales bacterium]
MSNSVFSQQLVSSDHLNLQELRAELYAVSDGGQTTIQLPNHMDIWREYTVIESNILTSDFAEKRPDVRTFRIVDKINPLIRGRLAISQFGMHAIIKSSFGTIYIENAGRHDSNQYFIYLNHNPMLKNTEDYPRPSCLGTEKAPDYQEPLRRVHLRSNDILEFGDVIRTYNMAIVTSGDFFEENGGTIPLAEDAVIFSVNSIQAIYEIDLGVQFNLLTPYIYTDPDTDPFIPGQGRLTMAANAIDNHFDVEDYDIGHVLHNSTGSDIPGGGTAVTGAVCRNNFWGWGPGRTKAAGWSGFSSNTSNGWIRLFAHEIGHMFNARHTFNGSGGWCGINSFSSNTNFEIGSGTTIMSYLGLCGVGQNIPSPGAADNYFHANSLERMMNYILDQGDCADEVDLGNSPPVADADPCGNVNKIPISTPFKLVGEGFDPDGDPLYYTWEQYDNDGATGPTYGKTGLDAASDPLAPLFRSFPSSNSPKRYFPNLDLLTNDVFDSPFEPLPTVERSLTFRLTVKDGHGGIGMDEISISVEEDGPLELTFPNGGEQFEDGDSVTVTWDVNGTDAFCDDVNILLSLDGGQTYPIALALEESNNGLHIVEIPEGLPASYQARIKVACAVNPCVVFFSISSEPFIIDSQCEVPATILSPDSMSIFDLDDPGLNLNLQYNLGSAISGFEDTIDTDLDESNLVFLEGTPLNCEISGSLVHYNVHHFSVDISGSYTIAHGGPFGSVLNLYTSPFTGPNCSNHVTSSAEKPNGSGSTFLFSNLTANLEAGVLYTLLVSSVSHGTPGYPFNYDIQFTSTPPAANIFDGVILPADYSYTFIAVSKTSDSINFENENSDFSGISPGTYDIYGIAYYSGSGPVPLPVDPNDWIGEPFSNILGNGCVVSSINAKPILVLPSDDCDASFAYDGFSSLVNPPLMTVEYCLNDSIPSPVLNGNLGGEFIANSSNITIDTFTGEIDLSSSLAGTYIVTYEDTTSGGCTESLEVVLLEMPYATASNDGPYFKGDTINLTASGGVSYSWVGPDGFSSTDQNPSLSDAANANDGTYSVTVMDENGCTDLATTEVVVNETHTISGSFQRGNGEPLPGVVVNYSGD